MLRFDLGPGGSNVSPADDHFKLLGTKNGTIPFITRSISLFIVEISVTGRR